MTNPLLQPDGLPAFSRIRPQDVEPALDQVLAANRQAVAQLLNGRLPSWETLVEPLDLMDEKLHRAWAPVAHLNAVRNSPELRAVYNACLPRLSEYETELGQHEGLYRAFETLANNPDFHKLDPAQQKVIRDELRDFRLSGVHLSLRDKQRFRNIMRELTSLQARFEENLLDATDSWHKDIGDESLLAGIPANDLQRAARRARDAGTPGWRLTLDYPGYHAVITHADNRALRQEIYEAHVTRASDRGPHAGRWDNSALMRDILRLREEAARLTGFASYAEYSLADKMAASPATVIEFLRDMTARVKPRAAAEFAELAAFAREELRIADLSAWDVAYCAEKLRQRRFSLAQETLRPYFPEPQVVSGLFAMARKLYGLRIEPVAGVDAWHPDVRFYAIHDAEGALRGHLYVDLFARPQKRSGAWMDECLNRLRTRDGLQTPVAHLVCNFAPPMEDTPSLLTHDDVLTLFHEFGHCLHHLLTRVDYAGVAGINGVPWDAVELPSQFHENFAWQREALNLIGKHYRTGEPLPDELYERLIASKHFHTGMHLARQLEFALFDMRLHMQAGMPDINELLREVRREVSVVPAPEFNRFAHGFSHIFAGGYAAGYYSYLWAEVMSSDAFVVFEETGVFDSAAGRRFMRTFLEQGGSRDVSDLFIEFRGRKPALDAFLRHNGLENG